MKFLQSMPFAAKIAGIGGLFLIPIILVIAVWFAQINGDATFNKSEKLGVNYTRATRPLFVDLESYRVAPESATGAKIDADFIAALAADANIPLGLTKALTDLQTKWARHGAIADVIADLIALQAAISDNSKITLDPTYDGYYVGDLMINKLPSLIDGVAQATVTGAAAIRAKSLSIDDRISIAELGGQVLAARDGIDHNVAVATGAASYLRIDSNRAAEKDSTSGFYDALTKQLLKTAKPVGNAASLTNAQKAAFTAALAMYDSAISAEGDVLDHHLAAINAKELTIFGIVFLLLGTVGGVMFLISRSLSVQLASVTKAIEDIVHDDIASMAATFRDLSNGDLTGSFSSERNALPVAGTDEVGSLTVAYNALASSLKGMSLEYATATQNMRDTLAAVSLTAKSLAAASDQANAAAQQSASAVAEIASAIDMVASGAADQSAQIGDTATAIEELSRTAEQIAQVANAQSVSLQGSMLALSELDANIARVATEGGSLSASARESSLEAQSGAQAVAETARTMSELRAASATATAAMSALEARSEQVGEIVESIDEIAGQTNLLALNAAIEAARAGDAGHGFAVVADEVRKLADRSRTATGDISKILGAIKSDSKAAADAMRASVASMDSGIAVAERASRSLGTMSTAIGATTHAADTVASQTQEMSDASSRVTENMTSTSAAVEQNAAAASEMKSTTDHVTNVMIPISATAARNAETAQSASAATQELAMGIGEIECTARSLRNQAAELDTLVDRFKIAASAPIAARAVGGRDVLAHVRTRT